MTHNRYTMNSAVQSSEAVTESIKCRSKTGINVTR